jgi:hypothetical protein
MSREEVETLVFAVSPARSMAGTGYDQQVEVLVVLNQL